MSNPDAENLRRLLDPGTEPRLDQLECFPELDSTNRYLLDQAGPAAGRFRVAMTDHQTAGRGRRGKTWRTPPLSSICLSLAYTFRRQPRQLSSLSLAAGIAAVDVLRNLPMQGVALKWPNDLM
ncbi:MAG: hypothetical protein OEY72_04005, partial [Gammaproteobacteria bacterium]|nr:hypothetical protein [Gammaproteobacteria bacterium]